MDAMAATTGRLRHAAAPLLALALAAYLQASGLFGAAEALAILACCACAYACLRVHGPRRRPESMLIVAGSAIFVLAYVVQAVLFVKLSRSPATSVVEALKIRSIFSLAALGAGTPEIAVSLNVILAGFVGMLAAALLLARGGRPVAAHPGFPLAFVANPLTLGYVAIVCTLLFGVLRKVFGLESPTASGLPPGVGGVINIASAYIGPNLSFAAFYYALEQGHQAKARRLAVIAVMLGLFNYVLFTSKLSLIFPVLFVLASQYLLQRRVVSTRAMVVLGATFVLVYPFLNLYRSAIALGIAPGELLAAVGTMYANQMDNSEVQHGALEVAVSAILGRLVGYDPLLILLQARPYPGSLLDYVLYGNLDKFLTYDILDFQDPMGYSPGFLGRLYYISASYAFVAAMTCTTVWLLGALVRRFWRGSVRLRFMAPLLLAYCLVFFTDGIRVELFRSLVVSTVFLYWIVRLLGKVRSGAVPAAGAAPRQV